MKKIFLHSPITSNKRAKFVRGFRMRSSQIHNMRFSLVVLIVAISSISSLPPNNLLSRGVGTICGQVGESCTEPLVGYCNRRHELRSATKVAISNVPSIGDRWIHYIFSFESRILKATAGPTIGFITGRLELSFPPKIKIFYA